MTLDLALIDERPTFARCLTCRTRHPVTMLRPIQVKEDKPRGTHDGYLDADARARRLIKNARRKRRLGG